MTLPPTRPAETAGTPEAGAPINQWKTLDKDLKRIVQLEQAGQFVGRPLLSLGIALVFIVLAGVAASVIVGGTPNALVIVAAAAFGAYMALNIGANDVANNMGPAVGANALTMTGALAIARSSRRRGRSSRAATSSAPSRAGSWTRPRSPRPGFSSGP